MVTKSQAIKNFLSVKTRPDLAGMYNLNMECQVNVAQDGGERVEDTFKGRTWHGWTDGLQMWKSFRIPLKAYSEPEFNDTEIKFDLAQHVEAIGMTGWDWKHRLSRWVAYDFDAIVGHSDKHTCKLTNDELERVQQAAFDLDWVTIRKSTSGKGLHLYVELTGIKTNNHHEHAALARSILGKMSALTGFNFSSKVDICGGNMWVYHRKMEGTDGLEIIKQGTTLSDIPSNWKDHVKVVSGKRRKTMPQVIVDSGQGDGFEELAGQRPRVKLDDEHKKVIEYLKEHYPAWWWDQDAHMLVSHTYAIKKAHEDLILKGFYETESKGSNLEEQNCFLFPMRKGAWAVRRFTPGVLEHPSWEQDGAGWTRTYLNREPDFGSACRAYGGLEDPGGGFVFREVEVAANAARLLGASINVGPRQMSRPCTLKQHKDGRLIINIERDTDYDKAEEMIGWLPKQKEWTKIANMQYRAPQEPEAGNYDDLARHLVTQSNEDYGWMVKSDEEWRTEPLSHMKIALASLGLNTREVTNVLGTAIFKCWKVVNKPFQPEYPGDREWNRNAAQFRYAPHEGDDRKFAHWLMILNHCGKGLDEAIKHNGWAKANGILTGGDYLKVWCASVFLEPLEPLPYLFMYGPQNSGKSIFHEALSLLLTKGYRRADAALINQQGFNGELEGAIICVVEETDLQSKRNVSYNRIKDWVTSRDLSIHAKNKTPYHIPNTTHWVQCSNDHRSCPIFPGDTRITMVYVEDLNPLELIPKKQLIMELEKEAPHFIAELLDIHIPPSNDRLNVPVINTEEKQLAAQMNKSPLEQFIEEKCVGHSGAMIKFSDLYDKFVEWLDPNEINFWSKIRVGKEMPPHYPKGRQRKDAQHYFGNLTWAGTKPEESDQPKLVLGTDGYLTPQQS